MAVRRQDPSGRTSLAAEVGRRIGGAAAITTENVEAVLRQVLNERQMAWRPDARLSAAVAIADELAGFGPIGPLLRDPTVNEVMVNASGDVFVERSGTIERTAVRFANADEVRHLIERVVSPLGLRIDVSSPWVDARLPDGARFHALVPPVVLGGPVVTIRKFSDELWTLEDLALRGAMSDSDAVRLAAAVRDRENVLVSGGGGTGKTTLVGVLARLVAATERIITIEDAAELRLGERHVVSLETRPPNVEGRGEVTMRDLVRCAMRMRADRIIVGEVRGGEALDMLQALTSGHNGSMTTVHANSSREALMRLEVMALLAAPGLSVQAARRQIAAAFDLVVHLARRPDGKRRVVELCEVRVGASGSSLRRIGGART